MPNKTDGFGIAAVSIGIVFIWGGAKGYSPLKAIENIVKGENPNNGQSTLPLTAANATASNAVGAAGNAVNQALQGVQGLLGGNAGQNQKIGQMMAASFGWTGTQWQDLLQLWDKESGWNQYAKNPTSGAYGIPQSLPPTKMPPAAQESGGSNVQQQILWGLQDIQSTYGSPSAAWQHELQYNWY